MYHGDACRVGSGDESLGDTRKDGKSPAVRLVVDLDYKRARRISDMLVDADRAQIARDFHSGDFGGLQQRQGEDIAGNQGGGSVFPQFFPEFKHRGNFFTSGDFRSVGDFLKFRIVSDPLLGHELLVGGTMGPDSPIRAG